MKRTKTKFKALCPELADTLGELKERRKKLEVDEQELVKVAKSLNWKDAKHVQRTVITKDGVKKVQYVYDAKGADYIMVLSKFPCLDASWRELYEDLYKEVNGKKAWAKHLKSLPRRRQSQLDVNPKDEEE